MSFKKRKVAASIVLYNDNLDVLKKALNSFSNSSIDIQLFLIDNSPTDKLKSVVNDFDVIYIHSPKNNGYGYANNLAIFHKNNISDYHVVCNSDIYFEKDVISGLIDQFYIIDNLALVMPMVLYPSLEFQNLVKKLPTPYWFFKKRIFKIKDDSNILDNNKTFLNVPYLSGCFMVFKTKNLRDIGGFDESFFLHFEDLDITRRILDSGSKTLYFPKFFIIHDHIHKSSLNFKMMFIYMKSAFKYFYKWGFLFDKKRSYYNNNIQNIN